MTLSKQSFDELQPGSQIQVYENNRALVYRADRVDPGDRVVEGVLMDESGAIITGFLMSFESWARTAERSRL